MTDFELSGASLLGSSVIVTGGTRGIGSEMALALVRAGANVVATGRHQPDIDAIESAASAIAGAGSLRGVRADVRSSDDCERAVSAAVQEFGCLTALINNAGVAMRVVTEQFEESPPPFWQVGIEAWQAIVETNLSGAFLMSRLAVPIMLKRARGRVLNISSSPAVMRLSGWSPYGASKAGIEALSAVWAQELAGTGVTVNVVRPGGKVDTGLFPNGGHGARTREGFLAPDVLNGLVVWLLSSAADDVNGRRFNGSMWDRTKLPTEAALAATLPYPERPHLF